jgi:redox-sensitive bicupin YhaK (pirin superfamily)
MKFMVRPTADRGRANHGWLDSYHTFSFADYYDPEHMGYRDLRVINEDVIKGGAGFPTHGHKDMEIITYMVRGSLAHKDSTGGEGVIKRGDVQMMTAGKGVRHSEFNASQNEDAKLLQIWILPNKQNLTPAYVQSHFTDEDKHNVLRLLVAPHATENNLTINQDVYLYASLLDAGASVTHDLKPGRAAWIQMVDGEIEIAGHKLKTGDAAKIEDAGVLKLMALKNSEFLLFDLV